MLTIIIQVKLKSWRQKNCLDVTKSIQVSSETLDFGLPYKNTVHTARFIHTAQHIMDQWLQQQQKQQKQQQQQQRQQQQQQHNINNIHAGVGCRLINKVDFTLFV